MISEQKPKTSCATNALKLVKWFTTNKYDQQKKTGTMAELNRLIKTLNDQKNTDELELFAKQGSLMCMRPLLTDNMSKDGIVAYFRYLMISTQVCELYKKLNIPLLVSRILQKENKDASKAVQNKGKNFDKENMQCLKFIQKWIEVSPKTVPKLLVSSLVAFGELPVEDGKKEAITIAEKKTAIGAIRKLSTNNPELCAWSGGIGILLNAIIDPTLEELSGEVVFTILYLINEPNTRNKTSSYLDISKIFWIFTDIDYNPDKKQKQPQPASKGKMQIQLDLGKKAIIKILKSWVGLVYLGNEMSVLKSFIQSLRQKIRPEVRTAIYEVLESLLMIGNNSSHRQRQTSSKLRIANLLNCYLITLVQLLIDCDLFKILVELSGLEDPQITVPAQKFLKQLTILMFNSLPNSSKYIDFLISAVTQDHQASISLKSCSSFVINKIGNYVFDKKPKPQNIKLLPELQNLYTPSTLYIPLTQASLNQTNYVLSLMPDSDTDQKLKNINQTTANLRQTKDKYQKWKWQSIQQILKHPYDNKTKNLLQTDRHQQNKLIKYLLRFYSPLKKQFITLDWHIDNFKYIKVGQLLVKNILNIHAFVRLLNDPGTSQFQISVSFIDQIRQRLLELMTKSEKQRRACASFYLTLQREIIVWIGLFSESKKGYLELLVNNDFFDLLEQCISKPGCEYILSVLLMYFDYSKENHKKKDGREIGPRDLLEKCLLKGNKQLMLQGIEVLKMLYKTEVINFQKWGFRIYAKILKSKDLRDTELMGALMDAIEEIFQEEVNVADFIEELSFQDLPRIKDSLSSNFLISLLSTEKGFNKVRTYLQDWLDQQYDRWISQKNIQYNEHMQDNLTKAFNFAQPSYNGFSLKQPNNQLQLLYIYKLPWALKIEDDTYPLFCRWKRNVFYLQAEIDRDIMDPLEMVLMIGCMPIDQNINIQTQGIKKIQLRLMQDNKLQKALKKPSKTLQLTQRGITYTLSDRTDKPSDIQHLLKVRIQLRIHKTFDNAQLPTHLMGELAKTPSGIQYLKDKKSMQFFMGKIENSDSPMPIRACLWALGQLGSSSLGMELIKQYSVIDCLIKMSYTHHYISLRGSCRYILNMLCASAEGRKEITKHGWLTNRNSNIGWICVPAESKKFFKIQKAEENYWAINTHMWNQYNSQLQPLNQKQKKLINNISMLSNTLSHKAAITQIKQMTKSNPQLTSSYRVIKNVILMMTFYRFRAEVRRFIYSIFDDYMKSAKFLSEIQNSKLYVI